MASNDAHLEALVNAYLRLAQGHRDEDFWAWKEVRRLLDSDTQAALDLTLQLLKAAGNDDHALAYVAAGPLEDLLCCNGAAVIDRIERESENDPRLQLALTGVWGMQNSEVYDRWYALMWKWGFADGRRQPL